MSQDYRCHPHWRRSHGGSCAAAILAEYGHRTLVLEREKFSRYHIGESLIPFTYGPLERIGMIPKMRQSHFVKKYSVTFVQPDGRRSQPFYFFAATTGRALRRAGRFCAPSSTRCYSTTPAKRARKCASRPWSTACSWKAKKVVGVEATDSNA